ncbi:MAG: hypothetical protein AB1486_02425 [Planctomycetota bacterium]
MKLRIRLVCTGLALLMPCAGTLPSCALSQPMEQQVTITTDRAAELFIGKKKIGETTSPDYTTTLMLARNESCTVMANDSSGATGRASIGTKLSALGILDIIGGCFFLIPFITLITGHAYELDPTRLKISLQAGSGTPEPTEDAILER